MRGVFSKLSLLSGLHLFPVLLGAFKSSVSVNYVLGAFRVAMTLFPIALLGKHGSNRWMRKLEKHQDNPQFQAYKPRIMRKLRFNTIAVRVLLIIPASLFGLVMLASLERTPLTGRLRFIVLSADEEEGIARDLAGPGWFSAINKLLSTEEEGQPKFIQPTDWRYRWVERVMRRLESVVPALQEESGMGGVWVDRGAGDLPYPPPADYPIVPRPRMAQSLHYLEPRNVPSKHQTHHVMSDVPPRSVLGPPYSLLVKDQPDQANAFSYGFGPNGSGGVVVFSGFLDEIMRSTNGGATNEDSPSRSFLARLFSPSKSTSIQHAPTPEQDAQLAILVAHELAHLLLSHHLETLSSANIFWPSLTSVILDFFRALLFPITMIGGPFINDALEQVGEVGKRELATAADACSSHKMEIEADIVSIRLLALAGWDPRKAVDFWEARANKPGTDCAPNQATGSGPLRGSLWISRGGNMRNSTHPLDELRVQKLRGELSRWETARERARDRSNKTAP